MKSAPFCTLLALSILIVGLNTIKPLGPVDDGAYLQFARQILKSPLDPYGFEMEDGSPAMDTLAPPLALYWWAGAYRFFGERPWLWKASFWPFAAFLVGALYYLFRRFSPTWELPLTAVTVLSPFFLPSWNLMLDLPALALALTAIALFLHAMDNASWPKLAIVGLVAGLAMQTKYTAIVVPAAFAYYAWLRHKTLPALVVAGLAVGVFSGWELWLLHLYGHSHFIVAVSQRSQSLVSKLHLLLPLLSTSGEGASWLAILSLAALQVRRRWIVACTITLVGSFLFLGLGPAKWQAFSVFGLVSPVTWASLLGEVSGCLLAITLACVMIRLCQGSNSRLIGRDAIRRSPSAIETCRCDVQFLIGWFFLEVAGCLALSPFPAARRVLGVQIVATLLVGRLLASRTGAVNARWGMVLAVVLGSLFYVVDLDEAYALRRAAERTMRVIRHLSPEANIWCQGSYCFEFHAQRAGMTLETPVCRPESGDWIVCGGIPPEFPRYRHMRYPPRLVVDIGDKLHLRTNYCFYGSATPMEHLDGPRQRVRAFQIPSPGREP